ncbi:phosphoribosylamine--glycine ligase [Ignicoccus pacificus DSM 13166]|uniref:phosphoribosylamine--glycine ligase n=1 Tax=Ignicoccus pacificus DSM 13166 TaxID=940294 RepID=A0A977KAL9_9CREN|nr:phosphoribosylamine--glycine ligase [Ignicoccus pacificus DSM 13166]
MKVLLVGGGSREHAIGERLVKEGASLSFISSNLNPGLLKLSKDSGGEYFKGSPTDPEEVLEAARKLKPELVVIGPEEPQFRGVADKLREAGFLVFGASSKASEIEKSKVFARSLMKKYNIPGNLEFWFFESWREALEFLERAGNVAIKPARQAGGKGVKVIADMQAYLSEEKKQIKAIHAKRILEEVMAKYTDIKEKLLVEERVEGVEYTVQAFTDGERVIPLPAVQDNPHLFEYDIGPETGGMGTVQGPGKLLPFLTEEEYNFAVKILEQVVRAIAKETGEKYIGAISAQMMLTTKGPVLIEFYSRLGDPEAVNVMNVVEGNVLEIMYSAAQGELKGELRARDVASTVKCIAPMGYPERRDLAKGHEVVVEECEGAKIYYGAVDVKNGKMISTGSRAIEVYAEAEDVVKAAEKANACARRVKFVNWKSVWRPDIGSEWYINRRKEMAEFVRTIASMR